MATPAIASALREARGALELGGKPVPPELFRDLGDGDLADAAGVMVSADLAAAIRSDRYAAPIEDVAGWRVQKDGTEETAYRLAGSTANGLLAIVTRYGGGGSGVFFTLHVVDINAAKALDADGHRRDRVELTMVQTVPLGDRWAGKVAVSGNLISIATSGGALAEGKARGTTVRIVARRP